MHMLAAPAQSATKNKIPAEKKSASKAAKRKAPAEGRQATKKAPPAKKAKTSQYSGDPNLCQ